MDDQNQNTDNPQQPIIGQPIPQVPQQPASAPASYSQVPQPNNAVPPPTATTPINQNIQPVVSNVSMLQNAAPLKNPKKKRLLMILIIFALVILGGVGGFYYWYSMQDHSVYSKLTTEIYDQNGIDFSFEYPSVLRSNPWFAAQEKNVPFAYTYYIGNKAQVIVFASYYPIDATLQLFNLTPAQFVSQIKEDSGSFITATHTKSDYAGCNKTILTNSGQTDAVCKNNAVSKNKVTFANVRITGATSRYQYTLSLVMLPSVLTNHQKVWQKVEKSFHFQ